MASISVPQLAAVGRREGIGSSGEAEPALVGQALAEGKHAVSAPG